MTKKATIAVPVTPPNVVHLTPYVANEFGYFKDENLTVELVRFDGTARAMPALLSGEVPISMLASGAMATAAAQGADVVYFATSSNKLLFQVLTPPQITSPSQKPFYGRWNMPLEMPSRPS